MDDPQQHVERDRDERHDGQGEQRQGRGEGEHAVEGEGEQQGGVETLHDADAHQHAHGVEVGGEPGHEVADARVVVVLAVEPR